MNHYSLYFMVALVLGGLVALATILWLRKQKNKGHSQLRQLIRLLLWISAASSIFAMALQVFLFATGRSPSWFPDANVFVSLLVAGLIYAQTSKSIQNKKQNGRTGSSS
jgi:peptidoglycan/LPS O-acetylase OafA/YrhL